MSLSRFVLQSVSIVCIVACGSSPSANADALDISVELAADRVVAQPGDTITWTLTVRNDGALIATGVIAADTLPSATTYASHSAQIGTFTAVTGIWDIGSMEPRSTASLIVRSVVNSDFEGTLTSRAGARSFDQNDPELASNVASASVIVSIPAVDEPVYSADAGDLILQDAMDQYTSSTAMWNDLEPGGAPRFRQQPFGEDPGSMILLSPGRGGIGKALRMAYSGASQTSAGWDVNFAPIRPDTTTHYFQYWARVTLDGPLGSVGNGVLAVKWFMGFHRSGGRVQWNTHDHLPCPLEPGGVGFYWQVYDLRETTCQGNQPIGPYPADIFDGGWHRFTHVFRANTSEGARDGIARMWIDGVKVVDVSASAVGIKALGAYKTWAEFDDVDGLSTQSVDLIRFGGTLTTNTPPFTIDVDDFMWWTKR